MIRTVTLDSCSISETKTNKNGQAFVMANIKVGEKFASMYLDLDRDIKKVEEINTWKAGDVKELNFEQNGEYTNFNLPTVTQKLEVRVTALEEAVFNNKGASPATHIPVQTTESHETVVVEDVEPNDIPF